LGMGFLKKEVRRKLFPGNTEPTKLAAVLQMQGIYKRVEI